MIITQEVMVLIHIGQCIFHSYTYAKVIINVRIVLGSHHNNGIVRPCLGICFERVEQVTSSSMLFIRTKTAIKGLVKSHLGWSAPARNILEYAKDFEGDLSGTEIDYLWVAVLL